MCKNLIKSELFIRIQRVWELNTNKNSSVIVVVVVAICCTNEFGWNVLWLIGGQKFNEQSTAVAK